MANHKKHQKTTSAGLPLISVIILVGPGSKDELLKTVTSILNSNYKNFEVIIVDNSCNNQLNKTIKRRFPQITLITMPANTGIFGYNVGFINARGEYIVVLDDDCVIKEDTLAQVVEEFKKQSNSVGVLSFNVYNPLYNYYSYSHYFQLKKPIIPTFAGGACAFQKKLFRKTGYYDQDFFCWFHEDDLALRIMEANYKIFFAKNIIVDHFDEVRKTRIKKLFLTFRNKAWLNIKYFSLIYFPLLILRDLSLIIMLHPSYSLAKRLIFGSLGYMYGYLSFITPFRKRQVVSHQIQKKYLKHYLFGRFVGSYGL